MGKAQTDWAAALEWMHFCLTLGDADFPLRQQVRSDLSHVCHEFPPIGLVQCPRYL
jgi:hypothetical protein